MNALKWVRGVNGTLGWFAPKLVASKMRLAFMTPRALPLRDWELPLLASSERITLRFGLSALRWGQRSYSVADGMVGKGGQRNSFADKRFG